MDYDESLEVGLAAGLDIPTAMVASESESSEWVTENKLILLFTVFSAIVWFLRR